MTFNYGVMIHFFQVPAILTAALTVQTVAACPWAEEDLQGAATEGIVYDGFISPFFGKYFVLVLGSSPYTCINAFRRLHCHRDQTIYCISLLKRCVCLSSPLSSVPFLFVLTLSE